MATEHTRMEGVKNIAIGSWLIWAAISLLDAIIAQDVWIDPLPFGYHVAAAIVAVPFAAVIAIAVVFGATFVLMGMYPTKFRDLCKEEMAC